MTRSGTAGPWSAGCSGNAYWTNCTCSSSRSCSARQAAARRARRQGAAKARRLRGLRDRRAQPHPRRGMLPRQFQAPPGDGPVGGPDITHDGAHAGCPVTKNHSGRACLCDRPCPARAAMPVLCGHRSGGPERPVMHASSEDARSSRRRTCRSSLAVPEFGRTHLPRVARLLANELSACHQDLPQTVTAGQASRRLSSR